MIRNTGLKGPDSEHSRRRVGRILTVSEDTLPKFCLQGIKRIHQQPELGSCAGESATGRFHAITGFDASGRDAWRGAQVEENGTFDPGEGALLEYVVQFMMKRGVIAYRPDEEYDLSNSLELWTEAIEGYPRRQLDAEHFRIDSGDLTRLRNALALGLLVFDGGGVTEKFMNRGPKQAKIPAGLDELGGNNNGHAQGIAGYWWGSPMGNVILYQGSWSEDFAGCYLPVFGPNGTVVEEEWQPGCFWAKAETFASRWDCWVLAVKPT